MFKKLFFVASILAVGYVLYYGFEKMKLAQAPEADLYSQVPGNSFLIWETSDFTKQWADLESNNIIWEELTVFSGINDLKRSIRSLDSTINTGPYSWISKNRIVFSLQRDATNEVELLVQFNKPKTTELKDVQELLRNSFKMKPLENSNDSIFHFGNNKTELYGQLRNGIISISPKLQALTQLNSSRVFIDGDSEFKTVKKTSSKNAKNKLFIKPLAVLEALDQYGSSQTQLKISTFPTTTSWVEFDTDIKPDEISMGGFAFASDSLNHWMSIFKNQEPVSLLVSEYLPNKTAFFMQFGFSDFKKLRSKLVQLESDRTGLNYDHPINQWDSIYGISVESEFFDWVDNEVVLSIVEPEQSEIANEGLVWVSSSDSRTLFNTLSDMVLKVDNQAGVEIEQIQYKEYLIQKLNIDDFLETCLGSPFSLVKENYFLQIDDYVVFANSPATLQWCVDRFHNGKTLKNDVGFQSFSERISGKSNLFIYTDISKSPIVYKHISSNKVKLELENNLEFLQKFQGASFQVSHESKDLYYVNNYLKYNPVGKQMPNTLWETKLKTASRFKPVVLKNHYTQAKEIFIQDTANQIYLVDNKGRILWQREISGKIMGQVVQVDMYKNEKLQITFNTNSHIYLIDRNGNDVKNFPIKLPNKASCEMLIADYDNSKNYRFIIPTVKGEVFNYGINGQPTKGWNFRNTSSTVIQPIKFIRVKGRDYLISVLENGKVIALNRRGEERLNFKSRITHPIQGHYYLEPGSQLSNSFIYAFTDQQNFVQISLTDSKDILFSIHSDSVTHQDYARVDEDLRKEFISTSKNRVSGYSLDGKELFHFSTRHQISDTPYMYHFNETQYVGLTSFQENKIFLVEKNGENLSPFPLKGASPFTITDINNDGRLNVLTIDQDGYLFNYTLN